ncbi:MAG: hypothetical protein KGO94_11940 [Alphaproteobacteria bacterium]|nr:hypothetical protein [Alphaproteobacteria bacterium]
MGDDKRTKLTPTIVIPPAKMSIRTQAVSLEKADSVGNRAPTKIAGEDRNRISVSYDDLKRLAPGAPRVVVDHAMRLINSFNTATANDRRAMMWGIDVQKSYADAVNAGLDLSQSTVFSKVEGHVARTLAILQTIDILQILGPAEGNINLSRIFAGTRNKIDTLAELDEARRELDQLSKLMGTSLKELLNLKDKLAKNVQGINAIATEADSHSLAALFLSEHLLKVNPTASEKFASRSLSLGQTHAQIREHSAINSLHVARPEQLIALVQQVALVTLPDFLAALSSILALHSRRSRISETEAREVEDKLRAIIQAIKN